MNSVGYIRGDIISWVLDGASSWVSVLHNRSPCQAEMEGERKKKEKAGNEKGRKFFFSRNAKTPVLSFASLVPKPEGKIFKAKNKNYRNTFVFKQKSYSKFSFWGRLSELTCQVVTGQFNKPITFKVVA